MSVIVRDDGFHAEDFEGSAVIEIASNTGIDALPASFEGVEMIAKPGVGNLHCQLHVGGQHDFAYLGRCYISLRPGEIGPQRFRQLVRSEGLPDIETDVLQALARCRLLQDLHEGLFS